MTAAAIGQLISAGALTLSLTAAVIVLACNMGYRASVRNRAYMMGYDHGHRMQRPLDFTGKYYFRSYMDGWSQGADDRPARPEVPCPDPKQCPYCGPKPAG